MKTIPRTSLIVVILLLILGGSTQFSTAQNQLTAKEMRAKALEAAQHEDATTAAYFLDAYIKESLDVAVIQNSAFNSIREQPPFQSINNRYRTKLSWGPSLYIYAGLIGFFIVILFAFQRKIDRVSTILLSALIFIHSFYIIHVGLHYMNYNLYAPHTYSMSTVFAFLYGPLFYFYFKRIKTGYSFQWKDLLHLLPTMVLLVYFLPIYVLSAEEKLKIMLGVGRYPDREYGLEISFGKMLSLIIYVFFTVLLFLKKRKHIDNPEYRPIFLWQRNIVGFMVVFTVIYTVYMLLLINYSSPSIMFHLQLITLSSFVLYGAYVAFAYPKTLMGYQLEASFLKYKNSGLTASYSIELKEALLDLLENKKVYRENGLNLNSLAERLGTTRHSASQIINEHFDLNFFELINQFRIEDAMQQMEADLTGQKNIIDIAYDVGYNNKATFNKSFKKINEMTPSQYRKQLKKKVFEVAAS
ncbi:helix-turn-helix domain-containing protein [Altibacter sp. HG106]|uniref:helix-turn-helix domain-containing protein n=1 Tax=Altibacter sp. HG106 TaxID=3023937 RepID=UPI00235026E5|nr:helix-turn-helix domain-containing protein [Altibacter sp. HG106]MDC7993482.1 helix-turn-helix domain-containing protein [Altibacter sp. HG106]